MNIKELREKAIKRYGTDEFPKEIYQSLGKVKAWFLNSLSILYVIGKTDLKVKIVDTIILLTLYQKALLIYQGSITRVHYVCILKDSKKSLRCPYI